MSNSIKSVHKVDYDGETINTLLHRINISYSDKTPEQYCEDNEITPTVGMIYFKIV